MQKTMRLEIYTGGGYYDREITYTGKNLTEIAAAVQRDENELLEYMRTGDDKGEKAFIFQGFMFRKAPLLAAQISEPDY